MTQTRQRHIAEYDYPGSLFPESLTRAIEHPNLGWAVTAQKDDGWYAVTIRTYTEKLFTAEDGDETWVSTDTKIVGKFVIGTVVHHTDIPETIDGLDTDILRSNIRGNSKDGYGVKTRRGNWQIASDYDRVLTVEQLAAEKAVA